MCCENCGLAFFCGPECQKAAAASHAGACAVARDVASRLVHEQQPAPQDINALHEFVALIGRHCNPVSASQKQGPSTVGSQEALRFLHEHRSIIKPVVADYLFLCCHLLMQKRVCCNPHIYAWCLLDGCMKAGGIDKFMDSIGLGPAATDSPLSEEQARQRYACHRHMDWQRASMLPLQEMFGQVGMGKFWDPTPRFPDGEVHVTCRDVHEFTSRHSCEYRRAHINEPLQELSFRRCKSRSL
ncbi:g10338 [Coccomyxa elongata]